MTDKEFIESITLEGEEWRDIVGFEGLYMVSSFGRVVSLTNTIKNGRGFRTTPPALRKPSHSKTRYCHLTLYKNHQKIDALVHRLVAQAFIPNPENKPMIDHIDRNRQNNNVSNLRWCFLSENMNNPNTIKHCKDLFANDTRLKHLSPVVLLDKGVFIKQYNSIKEAITDGFDGPGISSACVKRIKSHKGYQWMYLSDYESLVNKLKNDLPIQEDYPQ